MDEVINRFRFLNSKLSGRAWQEPEAKRVRRAAIAAARRMADEGCAIAEIARRFGIAHITVMRWLRTSPALREVAIVPLASMVAAPPPQSTPVVVLPSGVRVEGLSVAEVAALVRALG